MALFDELKKYDVNIDEALERFIGNADLYKMMLLKFTEQAENTDVMASIDAGEKEKAVADAHALKGVTGNLSLTKLFKAYEEIVNLMRADDYPAARKLLEDTLPLQAEIIDCIKTNA